MNTKPQITGPAAAMFKEPQQIVDDELFGAGTSPDEMRMQILQARCDELYDFLIRAFPQHRHLLPVNRIHRTGQ